jgi:S1-C subfamily serine protease
MRSESRVMAQRLFGAIVVVLVAIAGIALLRGVPAIVPPEAAPRAIVARGELAPAEETVIALFEATKPSVVAITTASRVFDPWRQRAHEVPRGTGSGFVWDAEGHIVTNFHVIEGATAAQVRLADGRVLPARLVGAAPSHDLAVLRIDAGGARPAPIPLGESGGLRVGQSVLAIGNPFGLDWTLTTGVVSALDRAIPGAGGVSIEGLIQTDAAINPGNSGGPLIDSAGRLIGVNTAIYSPSGSSAGIGFAVPVDTVNRVVPQLIRSGTYRPPLLGIVHDERINDLARRQGLNGVLVLDVEPGSPAATAGLRPAVQNRAGEIIPGDLVTGLGSRRIATSSDLRAALDQHAPGDTVDLVVMRDGQDQRLRVTLAPGR